LKKYLLATVLGIFGFSQPSEANSVALTTDGSIPSHVILDTRPIIFKVQSILRGVAPAVRAILSRAESLGATYITASFTDLAEGSFPGLQVADGSNPNPAVDATGGTITISFSPALAGASSIPDFTFTYTPNKDSQGNVVNWKCVSGLNGKSLGTTYIKAGNSVLDPITVGLGWPYDGCETPDE
jgi:hypothetical protein